jgi:CBS domain-containing protein
MQGPRLAEDIMVTKLVTLSSQTPVFEGIRMLLKNRITGAPVLAKSGRYLGVFSEKCCMSVLTLIARLAANASNAPCETPLARDFMVTNLVTLQPESDVFEAIGYLLKRSISGAPVVDDSGKFLGIFSEKTSMKVLVDAAYDQMPSTKVAAFANTDVGRVISEDTDLLQCARLFLETPYRRLEVLRDGRVVGQISRRDVLTHAQHFSSDMKDKDIALLEQSGELERSDGEIEQSYPRPTSTVVEDFMDIHARTIEEQLDLLSIAQLFLTTPYRRLPVLRDQFLVGQISRRDLLRAMHRALQVLPRRESALLYLSSLRDRSESPIQ